MQNKFNLDYYREILEKAQEEGFTICTLREFVDKGCPPADHLILRHDLDREPETLENMMRVEWDLGVQSTIFIRVSGPYNPFDYKTYPILKKAYEFGNEIGLHTNYFEFAKIHDDHPFEILRMELKALRAMCPIESLSCHRDLNYIHNSLPHLEENWDYCKEELGLVYHAYEKRIMDYTIYVNEGFKPHLTWRGLTPEQAISMKSSIYLLTHSHWWYWTHPFEVWQ